MKLTGSFLNGNLLILADFTVRSPKINSLCLMYWTKLQTKTAGVERGPKTVQCNAILGRPGIIRDLYRINEESSKMQRRNPNVV
jgi:hypothetical protein